MFDRILDWIGDLPVKAAIIGSTIIIVGLCFLMAWLIMGAKEECEASGGEWDTDTHTSTVIMPNGNVGTTTTTDYECERGN